MIGLPGPPRECCPERDCRFATRGDYFRKERDSDLDSEGVRRGPPQALNREGAELNHCAGNVLNFSYFGGNRREGGRSTIDLPPLFVENFLRAESVESLRLASKEGPCGRKNLSSHVFLPPP